MSKITQYAAITSIQSDDVLPIVDIHDTSMASSGTTKKISISQLQNLSASVIQPSSDTTGATDLTNLQAALTAVTTAGNGIVKGLPGSTFYINGTLVIGSNTVLDMTGCTILLVNGTTNATMLTDSAHNAGTLTTPSPVNDYSIIGGTWDRQNNSGPQVNTGGGGLGRHMFILGGNGIRIRDMNIQSTGAVGGAKYAFLIQNAIDFWIEDIRGNNYISDFIHMVGPCEYGSINNIYATGNKDDLIAISPSDWAGNLFGNEGDIADIIVQNIYADQQEIAHIVAIFSGKNGSTVLNTRRIKVKNIHGYVWSGALNPIYIGDTSQTPAAGGNIDDIIIDGVDVLTGASSQSLININGLGASTSIGVGSVVVKNITVRCDLTAVVVNYAPLAYLGVQGVTGTTTANPFTGGFIYQTGALAGITHLNLTDINITSAGTTGSSLISTATSGQTLTEVFLNDIWTSNIEYLASLITTTKLNLNNVHVSGNTNLINASSGASVTVNTTATNTFAVPTSTGSGTVTPFGNLALVADLGTSGYALTNGTGVITGMTWTAPNDGRMHTLHCIAFQYVTVSTETGGAVKLETNTSQGPTLLSIIFPGGSGTGLGVGSAFILVEPNQQVSLQQTSALSVGTANVWAQFWAA